jgi:hypothetical protein
MWIEAAKKKYQFYISQGLNDRSEAANYLSSFCGNFEWERLNALLTALARGCGADFFWR